MYIIDFFMFSNIYVIHIYKTCIFAPRLNILGRFFMYLFVLNLFPKLKNYYVTLYLYEILVTLQLSKIVGGGGAMFWLFDLVSTKKYFDVVHMYSFSQIVNCIHKTKLDLHIKLLYSVL